MSSIFPFYVIAYVLISFLFVFIWIGWFFNPNSKRYDDIFNWSVFLIQPWPTNLNQTLISFIWIILCYFIVFWKIRVFVLIWFCIPSSGSVITCLILWAIYAIPIAYMSRRFCEKEWELLLLIEQRFLLVYKRVSQFFISLLSFFLFFWVFLVFLGFCYDESWNNSHVRLQRFVRKSMRRKISCFWAIFLWSFQFSPYGWNPLQTWVAIWFCLHKNYHVKFMDSIFHWWWKVHIPLVWQRTPSWSAS